jgi:hypothetical protein
LQNPCCRKRLTNLPVSLVLFLPRCAAVFYRPLT